MLKLLLEHVNFCNETHFLRLVFLFLFFWYILVYPSSDVFLRIFNGVAGLGRQEHLDATKTDKPHSLSCKTRTGDGC